MERNKKTRLLITGGSGLLGSNLTKIAIKNNSYIVYYTYNQNKTIIKGGNPIQTDLTTEANKIINLVKPDIIIHCAALTNVDFCEKNPKIAYSLNTQMTKNLLENFQGKFVYISTDSVFDGKKGNYSENDQTNPINLYSKTKLQGENEVKKTKDYLIIRTNIYGINIIQNKLSLAEWFLNKLEKNEEITGFEDVYFNPLNVDNLSQAILEMINKDLTRTYHVSGPEKINKYEFAKRVAKKFNLDEQLIKSGSINNLNLTAPRPKDTSLSIDKIKSAIQTKLLDIDSGLELMKIKLKK